MENKQGWVYLLEQKLKKNNYTYKVINISATGATTSNGLSRLPQALEEYKPTITIIALGGNDGLRGLPLETIKSNLNKMAVLIRKAGSKVLLAGVRLPPNYGPQYTSQFQAIFPAVADANKASVVPMMLKGVGENWDMFQSDGIHPTAEAQEQILNNVWTVLQPML